MKRPVSQYLIYGGVAVLALGSFLVVRTLSFANHFVSLTPHFEGTCQRIAGAIGPEDLQIDHDNGLVYISAFDRRAYFADETINSALYLYDLNHPDRGLMDLTPHIAGEVPGESATHGLSLHRGADGHKTLMVVVHTAGRDRVDTYDIEETVEPGGEVSVLLTYRNAVLDSHFVNLNDVVAVDDTRFYATNDHLSKRGSIAQMIDDFGRRDSTNAVYFNGKTVRIVAEELTYANGINVSADGSQIYIAETTDQMVRFYDRDIESGDLTLNELIAVNSGADNLDVAPDGSIWVGSHPKILALSSHMKDSAKLSPSEVIRLAPAQDGAGGELGGVYLNLGEEISSLSVAAQYGDQMVLGQILNDGFLVCDLPGENRNDHLSVSLNSIRRLRLRE